MKYQDNEGAWRTKGERIATNIKTILRYDEYKSSLVETTEVRIHTQTTPTCMTL
jgi:hypothetical protein